MSLFEHYPATPGSIYAASDQAATAGDQCRQLGSSVDGRGQVACTSVMGDLDAPLFAAPQPVVSSSQALDGSSLIVHGCLNLWGDMVTTYNGEIDALNQEWATAQANSFGVDSSAYAGPHCGTESPDGGQGAFDDAVADASAALRADLVRRKATAGRRARLRSRRGRRRARPGPDRGGGAHPVPVRRAASGCGGDRRRDLEEVHRHVLPERPVGATAGRPGAQRAASRPSASGPST